MWMLVYLIQVVAISDLQLSNNNCTVQRCGSRNGYYRSACSAQLYSKGQVQFEVCVDDLNYSWCACSSVQV